jgi:hypothetical protein
MTQIALPFDSAPRLDPARASAPRHPLHPASAFDAAGWRVGWEHARHGIAPPADHLHAGNPVREGWQAGKQAFGARALAPSRAARLWLALRLQAWRDGRAVDEWLVTPRLLARIDAARCLVTREPLRDPLGVPAPADAVVVSLGEGGAVAAGSLLVVSRRAAQALAVVGVAEALARAADPAAASTSAVPPGHGTPQPAVGAGLDAAAWRRLAALRALAAPAGSADARAWPAGEPLPLLPPPRLRVRHPQAALQVLLTQLFLAPAWARRMAELAALLPSAALRRPYFLLMNALLSRRMSARPGADAELQREVLEQAWAHPIVRARWQALTQTLTDAASARLTRLAVRRGLVAGLRWLEEADEAEGAEEAFEGARGANDRAVPACAASAAPARGGRAARPPAAAYRGAGSRAGALGTSRPAEAMSATRRTPARPITRSSSESST